MMKEYSSKLPKGTPKEELLTQGRVQSIKVNRQMKPDEVKKLILKAFGVTHYTVLHCDGISKYFMKSSEQNIDGNRMVDRRGCLYLCENMEVARYLIIHQILCLDVGGQNFLNQARAGCTGLVS